MRTRAKWSGSLHAAARGANGHLQLFASAGPRSQPLPFSSTRGYKKDWSAFLVSRFGGPAAGRKAALAFSMNIASAVSAEEAAPHPEPSKNGGHSKPSSDANSAATLC